MGLVGDFLYHFHFHYFLDRHLHYLLHYSHYLHYLLDRYLHHPLDLHDHLLLHYYLLLDDNLLLHYDFLYPFHLDWHFDRDLHRTVTVHYLLNNPLDSNGHLHLSLHVDNLLHLNWHLHLPLHFHLDNPLHLHCYLHDPLHLHRHLLYHLDKSSDFHRNFLYPLHIDDHRLARHHLLYHLHFSYHLPYHLYLPLHWYLYYHLSLDRDFHDLIDYLLARRMNGFFLILFQEGIVKLGRSYVQHQGSESILQISICDLYSCEGFLILLRFCLYLQGCLKVVGKSYLQLFILSTKDCNFSLQLLLCLNSFLQTLSLFHPYHLMSIRIDFKDDGLILVVGCGFGGRGLFECGSSGVDDGLQGSDVRLMGVGWDDGGHIVGCE